LTHAESQARANRPTPKALSRPEMNVKMRITSVCGHTRPPSRVQYIVMKERGRADRPFRPGQRPLKRRLTISKLAGPTRDRMGPTGLLAPWVTSLADGRIEKSELSRGELNPWLDCQSKGSNTKRSRPVIRNHRIEDSTMGFQCQYPSPFQYLTSDSRVIVGRQRTGRAVFDWRSRTDGPAAFRGCSEHPTLGWRQYGANTRFSSISDAAPVSGRGLDRRRSDARPACQRGR
jgi:hypothetical protein